MHLYTFEVLNNCIPCWFQTFMQLYSFKHTYSLKVSYVYIPLKFHTFVYLESFSHLRCIVYGFENSIYLYGNTLLYILMVITFSSYRLVVSNCIGSWFHINLLVIIFKELYILVVSILVYLYTNIHLYSFLLMIVYVDGLSLVQFLGFCKMYSLR